MNGVGEIYFSVLIKYVYIEKKNENKNDEKTVSSRWADGQFISARNLS